MVQGQITWFEIPVEDLDRAITFYTNVLVIKIEKNKFLKQEYGVFNRDINTIKGALVKKENHQAGTGIVLFFYVIDLSESLKNVEQYGGKVLIEKTLLEPLSSKVSGLGSGGRGRLPSRVPSTSCLLRRGPSRAA